MKKFLLSIFAVLFAFAGVQAEGTWTLVKSVSDLAVGDKVVIAAAKSNYAMSTTQNGNNRAHTAITKTGDTVTLTSAVQVLTLAVGKTAGTFAFYTGSGYLYAASSSKNYLKTEKTLSNNSSWSITIASTGVATIKSTGSNTRNWLRYNSSNNPPIFSCYGSGQTDVCLYKYVEETAGGDEVVKATPPSLPESCSFKGEKEIEITNNTEGGTVYYSTNGVKFDKYTEPFTIDATTTVTAYAQIGDDEATKSSEVSAKYTKIEPKKIAEVIAAGEGEAMTTGTVVATYSRGFLLGDGTAYILVYQGLNPTNEFSVGDAVSISGPVSKYGGLFQFGTATVIDKTGEAELTHPEVTTMDGAAMDEYLSEPSIQYVEYTGVLTISGTYYNVAVEGAKTAICSIQYPKEGVIEAKDKDVVKVTGYTIGISNSDNEPKYVNTMAVKVEVVEGGITEPEEPETPVDGPSWTLVEKVGDINAGDEVIIAYNNYGLGAKSNTSTVYHTKVDIKTTNDGKALTDIGEAKVLTVGKNGDSYTFSYDGNYLYWSSGNSLSTNVSVSDNSSWTIAIDKGEATISNKKDNTRKLQYNASSPRFACYTGTQQNVRIYKKVETSLTSYTLSVTDAGYATLFLDFAAAIPKNVEVYTVTAVNTGYVTLTQVTGVLPANTGVIVKAGKGDYNFVASTVTPATVTGTGNLLQGTVDETEINVEAYVLGNVDGVGLYKAKMAGGVWLNNANKAYLPASEVPTNVKSLSFRFGEGTTGVENVEVENEVKAIYDLTGRRVEEVTAPGVYIVNGKKVLVK